MSAIRKLEELAMNAWPAEVIQTVEGWRLRFTQGVSRRANSAWSNQAVGSTALAARISGVEAFYQARGADACFHISPLSPPDLDAMLGERGYFRNGDTCVQTASLEEVLDATPAHASAATLEMNSSPTPTWEEVAWPGPNLRPEVRREILYRIGPATVCCLAREAGRPVAAGLGVYERGHIGIFAMRTHEAARGRGHASAVLHALARWGDEQGAGSAYLQVEADNPGAQDLYTRTGFATTYGYHYMSRKAIERDLAPA